MHNPVPIHCEGLIASSYLDKSLITWFKRVLSDDTPLRVMVCSSAEFFINCTACSIDQASLYGRFEVSASNTSAAVQCGWK